jgi:dihydropteroate synthase
MFDVMHWQTNRFVIRLDRPQVMGIVNATPDSFFDGGRHAQVSAAMAYCEQLLQEGADILDIGGESTRPGAQQPGLEEELARVLPVLRHAVRLGVPVSVDTSRPEVIRAALDLGVDIINDVRALAWPDALATVATHPRCGVCLMHMQGEPGAMQHSPVYAVDVVAEVTAWLRQRVAQVQDAGVALDRIAIDPGIGFGKTAEHNWTLLQRQEELLALGRPLLLGWSRKSTLGALTGRPVEQRLVASVVAALASVQRGAQVVRVHDVAATVDAIKVWHAAGLLPSMMGCDDDRVQGITPDEKTIFRH